jgi:hypothetical protein|tara:strand:+ start:483 stop:935 length:453 start_codon:yes stop_codon:yes gene_type:complete
MPTRMEYWSDASFTSDSDDDEDEAEDIYDPRDVDYWNIEEFLETRGPPPVIEYAQKIGTVALRQCVVGAIRSDIESVIHFGETFSWNSFWEIGTFNEKSNRNYFSFEDWDAIGEYCFSLCEQCNLIVDMDRVRSCMIRILEYGHFKNMRQ